MDPDQTASLVAVLSGLHLLVSHILNTLELYLQNLFIITTVFAVSKSTVLLTLFKIYDGSYTARGAKLRYCGSRTPPMYRSTENKVFLLFQTDDRITYTGFNITFRQINQFEFTTIDIID